MESIPDHIKENLRVLFIGFNPSIRSGETGHHYANPTNRFWTILQLSGLTERKYSSEEDYKLLDLGYGLTNIVAKPTKNAAELTKAEYEAGRKALIQKISRYKPKIACFVGKGVYEQFSRQKNIPWGKQQRSVVPGTIDFVAPSSSGLVRMKIVEIAAIYRELKELLSQLEK
ncbi:TDG/mug DNA glycosylase family protein [Bacillus thermophilus]|uniref:TDG/mug DNA glycosylase family protein n=1 Tax=Siminovitchia thermophila TaxID=1245522 RepID=A0ABS2RB26_9BACI|nr:G/U mismatch-specific DNA glycosylase [Siminovitchia thermophila]MBM7716853.1 TDG/mug DNA glycosylase family protein [Siminovitchia thermophila]ONK22072.1 double-stranded uracil-DNA glycosylase [Bacillus sp. VT-16-64]